MSGSTPILGPDGRPVSAERVRMDKQTRFNPLSNWTPDVLVRQLTAFARGEIKDLAWVMEWLENHDDIISTVAPKAKAAVSREGYDVVLRDEIAPEDQQLAEDQRGVLQAFYDSIEVGHAIDGDVQGGFRLLTNQVMDGYGKGWSTHHLVWNPTSEGLRCEAIQVPLWFWEATHGSLRYLPHYSALHGVDRDELGGESAWLVARGRGVMLACAIASMFKRIPLQDWLTYCDRHGMPSFLGKTSAAKGQPGWNDLFSAVSSIGSEFGAVVNNGDSIEVLDLTTKGELPYEKLIDRMDRAAVMLWRGGDLSTISRSDGVGSNPQQEETDDLDADNALWVAETIDRKLSRTVLDWHFGEDVPQLAELNLRTKTRDNVTEDLAVVKAAKEMGVRVSKAWFVGKFGVQAAEDGEEALGDSDGVPSSEGQVPREGQEGTGDDAAGGDDADAVNTAEAFEGGLAEVLGVRAEMLAPARPLLARLREQAGDQGLSDEDFLRTAEELADLLPEFVDGSDAAEFAGLLEAALGGAALQGVRNATESEGQR